MSDPRPIHRLFGLSWEDFFYGTSVVVETEVDLSLRQQYLDLVIIHKGPGPLPRKMPDGFEDMAAHNLITFKSHQESLDEWALLELLGHFVNYRKQSSPSMNELLPAGDFRLYAVCARFPTGLANDVSLTKISEGVYEVRVFSLRLRIIVASRLPLEQHNAMMHLFSAREELLRYGREHYRQSSVETSTVLMRLLTSRDEEINMPSERMKQLVRETKEELLREMSLEERLRGASIDELLRALSSEARAELISKLKINDSPADNS